MRHKALLSSSTENSRPRSRTNCWAVWKPITKQNHFLAKETWICACCLVVVAHHSWDVHHHFDVQISYGRSQCFVAFEWLRKVVWSFSSSQDYNLCITKLLRRAPHPEEGVPVEHWRDCFIAWWTTNGRKSTECTYQSGQKPRTLCASSFSARAMTGIDHHDYEVS